MAKHKDAPNFLVKDLKKRNKNFSKKKAKSLGFDIEELYNSSIKLNTQVKYTPKPRDPYEGCNQCNPNYKGNGPWGDCPCSEADREGW